MMPIINGMPVWTNRLLTITVEDWSGVRSMGRARRRRRQGHRQRIVVRQDPNPEVFIIDGRIHGHPTTIEKLLSMIALNPPSESHDQ